MAVARWLETDTNANKDISSAVSIGAYTADADRMIVCDVSIDQAVGGGDYVVYLTRQINGAGSAYVMLPKTTCTAAAGETAIAMQSGPVTVRSGDVVTCYVDGLAGDTTTPDTTVRWFEMATLRPATADRQLIVAATGEASANVTLWKGATAPAMTGDAYARLGAPAGASVSADIAAIAADVAAIDNSGTYSYSNTVDDGSGNLLDGVYIQLSTDSGFTNIVTTTHSNASGAFTVRSDTAGTHYLRLQLAGYSFTDQTVTLA